jgi:multidrug resistance efflux pump
MTEPTRGERSRANHAIVEWAEDTEHKLDVANANITQLVALVGSLEASLAKSNASLAKSNASLAKSDEEVWRLVEVNTHLREYWTTRNADERRRNLLRST